MNAKKTLAQIKKLTLSLLFVLAVFFPALSEATPTELERRQLAEYRARAIKAIRLTALKAKINITQIIGTGALASGFYIKDVEYMEMEYGIKTRNVLAGPGRSGVIRTKVPVGEVKKIKQKRVSLGNTVYVAGLPPDLVDGNWFVTLLYPCGRYQYINTLGGQATVSRYATSPELAADFIEADFRKRKQ